MGYTKGPWFHSMGGKSDVRAGNPKTGQMIANTLFVSLKCANRAAKTAECRANAHLIACAPSMFEALEEIVNSYEAHEDGYARSVLRKHYETAKTILLKASGGESDNG